MTRSMFTLLQASNGMDGCRVEHCCAQINGQFILAPFAEVLTLDGWCDDIVRHVVYRQPVMGVVDLASWSLVWRTYAQRVQQARCTGRATKVRNFFAYLHGFCRIFSYSNRSRDIHHRTPLSHTPSSIILFTGWILKRLVGLIRSSWTMCIGTSSKVTKTRLLPVLYM